MPLLILLDPPHPHPHLMDHAAVDVAVDVGDMVKRRY